MNPDNNILQELNEISPLVAGIPKITPYKTTEGYFESARMELLSRSGIGNPYQISNQYFEAFPNILLQTLENESGLSLPRDTFSQNNPFHIPDNYFADFETKLISQLPKHASKGVVKRMNNWKIWSAAACLTGLLGLALFFETNHGNKNEDWKLSWKEAKSIMEKGNLEQEFNQVNPEELATFLIDQGHDVDAAVMACVAEESDNDEEWIYLQNEKEIEAFLEESNSYLN